MDPITGYIVLGLAAVFNPPAPPSPDPSQEEMRRVLAAASALHDQQAIVFPDSIRKLTQRRNVEEAERINRQIQEQREKDAGRMRHRSTRPGTAIVQEQGAIAS